MNTINLKDLDLNALKALAYDLLVVSENTQNNLKAVNQEIALRNQPSETKPEASVAPETNEDTHS